MVNASGSAAAPQTSIFATPNSVAKLAIWEMTIRPEVDISVIITNISQNTGVFSIAPVSVPGPAGSCAAAGGAFNPSPARNPIATRAMHHIAAASPGSRQRQ